MEGAAAPAPAAAHRSKRVRGRRGNPPSVSVEQWTRMFYYLEANRNTLMGLSNKSEWKMWDDLAAILNDTAGGRSRTRDEWKDVWKARLQKALAKVHALNIYTISPTTKQPQPLNDHDERILSIAGQPYKRAITVSPTDAPPAKIPKLCMIPLPGDTNGNDSDRRETKSDGSGGTSRTEWSVKSEERSRDPRIAAIQARNDKRKEIDSDIHAYIAERDNVIVNAIQESSKVFKETMQEFSKTISEAIMNAAAMIKNSAVPTNETNVANASNVANTSNMAKTTNAANTIKAVNSNKVVNTNSVASVSQTNTAITSKIIKKKLVNMNEDKDKINVTPITNAEMAVSVKPSQILRPYTDMLTKRTVISGEQVIADKTTAPATKMTDSELENILSAVAIPDKSELANLIKSELANRTNVERMNNEMFNKVGEVNATSANVVSKIDPDLSKKANIEMLFKRNTELASRSITGISNQSTPERPNADLFTRMNESITPISVANKMNTDVTNRTDDETLFGPNAELSNVGAKPIGHTSGISEEIITAAIKMTDSELENIKSVVARNSRR